MNIGTLVWALFLSCFSTSVICYVALATPLGPWMGPTLALFSIIVFAPFCRSQKEMVLAVCAGSIGGIAATALSFSFPTFYFLNPEGFSILIGNPLYFFITVAGVVFSGGYYGIYCAKRVRHHFLEEKKLAFPIGQLVYKIINAQHHTNKTKQLIVGVTTSVGYALLQFKQFGLALIPTKVTVWKQFTIKYITVPGLRFDLTIAPLFISIGFIAGHAITIPLLIGALSRMFVADPVRCFCFKNIPSSDFLFAFCAGIVLSGVVVGVTTSLSKMVLAVQKWLYKRKQIKGDYEWKQAITPKRVMLVAIISSFLSWAQFSLLAQIYIIGATAIAAYQIAHIAGKIGLALLGRFATFILIPGLLFFGFDALQIAIVSAFVELCGGVASEALFGYKTAQLAGVNHKEVYWYQLFGLAISSCVAAGVFYFLVIHFGLGSEQLFAQRGQARALLVQATSFNYYVLVLGVFFGILLKRLKFSPMLVLGGFLMPLSSTFLLSLGGFISWFVKSKEEYDPLCSGIYAANALTILVQLVLP